MKVIIKIILILITIQVQTYAGGGMVGGGGGGSEEGGQADEIRMKIVDDVSNLEELLGDEGAGGPKPIKNIMNVHNISVKEFINFNGKN